MKIISKIVLYTVCLVLVFASCESFLEKKNDVPLTFDKIWETKLNTEKYLMAVYGFMPDESVWVDDNPWTAASDEASVVYDRGYRSMNNGTWNSSNLPFGYSKASWYNYYRGIREANIFMLNVDRCPEITAAEKVQWKTEVRFLRAYYYFMLLRMYGAVILVGDEPIAFDGDAYGLAKPRNTYTECEKYIEDEMNACADILPASYDRAYFGKPTKAVAWAVVGRLKLYSARKLFNGAGGLYNNVKNPDGTNLFVTTENPEKWKEAVAANKKVIDHAESTGLYALYEDPSGDPYKSYQNLFLQKWNKELIFARYVGAYYVRVHVTPTGFKGSVWGGIGPTQQQVDAYAMKSGVYPITGYDSDGSPIIDPRSNYSETGKTSFNHPLDNKSGAISTPNMYIDREPRFYVNVLWSGAEYPNAGTVFKPTFHKNGNSGPVTWDYPKPGYLTRKYTDPEIDVRSTSWGDVTYPMIRLGEVYLNYVEALIESNPASADIFKYWNLIRKRAGVPDIQTAYPEVIGNQDKMRDLIRKERRIELTFEGHRYFDTRTWMIAEQTDAGPMYGMNIQVLGPDGKPEIIPDAFWQRTVFETRIFEKKHYLFPFMQRELDRNRFLVIGNNYGW